MSRAETIINGLEKDYGIECERDFETELCDGDTCRHAECECWDFMTSAVEAHLEAKLRKVKLKGSLSVAELREMLGNCDDQDAPVFVDGKPIHEAWWVGDDGYFITSQDEATTIA